jgi:hypothetical protein
VGILSKIAEWRFKIFLWVGLPAITFAAFAFAAPNVGPAWRAHNGDGISGTFTAVGSECGRRSCTLRGTWTATDGSATRPDVALLGGPDSLPVDGTVEAVDAGADDGVFVLPTNHHLIYIGLVLAGVLAAVGWIFVIIRAVKRRAARPERAAAA